MGIVYHTWKILGHCYFKYISMLILKSPPHTHTVDLVSMTLFSFFPLLLISFVLIVLVLYQIWIFISNIFQLFYLGLLCFLWMKLSSLSQGNQFMSILPYLRVILVSSYPLSSFVQFQMDMVKIVSSIILLFVYILASNLWSLFRLHCA